MLRRMVASLTHRGPDGWGVYMTDQVALGHRRLSIMDIGGGSQPMVSDRYVIAYNGEIYNHIEIRKELEEKGVLFHTTCDTEVVLKAFEFYGADAFERFNGQFALVIWDKLSKKLIAARDRFGVRPLYVLKHGSGYYFSSEIKAFDCIIGYRREFDVDNLYEHGLFWNTIGDETIYKHIRSIESGTFEVYDNLNEPQKKRYYEIGESQGKSPSTFEEAQEEFESLLNDSVRLRLRSDVPVGAYLSGGIDSSVVTHLITNHQSKPFKTFSVSFEDKEFDESIYQNEMVRSIHSDHRTLTVSYKDINDNFSDAVYHTERPIFRTAAVPLFMLSQMVRENDIKVVLTGEGADEILFGYDSYKELKLLEFWRRSPESKFRPLLIKSLYPHLQHYNDPKKFGLMKMYYRGFLDDHVDELAGLNIRVHNNSILANYFNKDYRLTLDKPRLIQKIKRTLPDNYYSWSQLQQNQFMEMKSLLSGYLLSSQGDRMSLAHGVEGRYPFLDHRVVETLFYFADSYKLSGFSQKYLLGKCFEKKLPNLIINRPKKPYTAPDLKSFFYNGSMSEQASYFLSEDVISSYGIFDSKYVNRIVQKFNGKIPAEIGYRDNMIITFILSCQMAKYWADNPRDMYLDDGEMTVNIIEP